MPRRSHYGGAKGALLGLFFLSGCAALAYQVAWVRMLKLVFGVTSFAVVTVLSAFMAGLALGSLLGGRFIDKRRDPLRVFCGLQIGIAAFALLFPVLVSGLTLLYVGIYRHWVSNFYLFGLLRFALAFVVLLVPSTLMGATLPVLAKFFVRAEDKLGSDLAALYSVNNWGAVLGALAADFALIELLGVRGTTYLAAAISALVGLAALYLGKRAAGRSPPPVAAEPVAAERAPARYPRYILHIALWVFAIEGFTSLAYEVVWTRILAGQRIVITVYAYSLVAATFVAGLAIGSLLVRRFADRKVDLLIVLAGIEVGIGLSALLLLPLFNMPEWYIGLRGGMNPSWARYVAATAVWVGALMLVPSTLMGATFPVVSKIYVDVRQLGRRLGWVGCLDTLGSVFGALAAGFILIPLLGIHKSVLLLAAVNVLLGLLVLSTHPGLRRARKTVALAAVSILTVVCYWFGPRDLRFVPACYATGNIHRGEGVHILHYEEDIDATVVVAERFDVTERVLSINGADVAGTGRQLETTQLLQGHLPLLLYEAQTGKPARRVLTVGMGSGGTSGALGRHDLEAIHCVELNPGVPRASRKHFERVHRNVFDDPRYRVFIQDGRTYLLATDETYDVIMTESVHPTYAGNAGLYSRDYYEHCKARLKEDGVISVWVPIFLLSHDDLRMICRTFTDVFPHAGLWRANNGLNKHVQLIATGKKLAIDFQKFRDRVRQPAIRGDLAPLDLDDVFALLNSHWLDEKALAAYSLGARVHTDNHPYLAFSAPRSNVRERPNWVGRLRELYEFRTTVIPYVKTESLGKTDEEKARNGEQLAVDFNVASRLIVGFALQNEGNLEGAIQIGKEALEMNPDDKACRFLLCDAMCSMALAQSSMGRMDDALKTVQEAIAFDPDYSWGHVVRCVIHAQRGELEQAIESGKAAEARLPVHLPSRYSVALMYADTGQPAKAKAQLEALLALLPGNEMVAQTLEGRMPGRRDR